MPPRRPGLTLVPPRRALSDGALTSAVGPTLRPTLRNLLRRHELLPPAQGVLRLPYGAGAPCAVPNRACGTTSTACIPP